jgi:hypothetical protein
MEAMRSYERSDGNIIFFVSMSKKHLYRIVPINKYRTIKEVKTFGYDENWLKFLDDIADEYNEKFVKQIQREQMAIMIISKRFPLFIPKDVARLICYHIADIDRPYPGPYFKHKEYERRKYFNLFKEPKLNKIVTEVWNKYKYCFYFLLFFVITDPLIRLLY